MRNAVLWRTGRSEMAVGALPAPLGPTAGVPRPATLPVVAHPRDASLARWT